MPKKQPRNAFYFYMHDFKEKQRLKGINYANMSEVAVAAGPFWQNEIPKVRKEFEDKAKKEKEKFNGPEMKYTSTGVSFAHIQQQQKEQQYAEETERRDIDDLIKLNCFRNTIQDMDIYLMDVNFYCKAGNEYLIGESTVLRFNLADGVKDKYHENINPGKIPTGFAFDVKAACTEYGLEMPDDSENVSNYTQILANIIDFLKIRDRSVKTLPPIFTMPDKVVPVQDFIFQMCRRASEDETIFRVYKLDRLFFTLINAIKKEENEGFPGESLALAQLKIDTFRYTPGLGCEMHEKSASGECDRTTECTSSRCKRWAYVVLDNCCTLVGIELQPGRHVPADLDVEGIISYKEQKKERRGPTVAENLVSTSSCNTTVNDSFDDSFNNSWEVVRRDKRVHMPQRMPKTDLSASLRPAPGLTGSRTIATGHGRGRSLSSSLDKMKLDK